MFVELIEQLRCPNGHEDAPLIAAARRTDARHIVDGVLGCPVCHAEFPIADGVARFAPEPATSGAADPSPDVAMRIAAFLELTDARGFALLTGRWAAHADQIRRLSDTPLVAVNPAGLVGDVAGTMIVADRLPFAPGSARAAALDAGVHGALAESIVRAVRAGGRVMGAVSLPVPAALTELVRDDRAWVAEKNAAPDPAPRLTTLERPRRG